MKLIVAQKVTEFYWKRYKIHFNIRKHCESTNLH